MKNNIPSNDDFKSTLEKHQTDLINKLEDLNLSEKDHKMAMSYLDKGEKMAENISNDSVKLKQFTDILEKAKTSQDIMKILISMFKQEFIRTEGKEATKHLDAFCKIFDSKKAKNKLKEYDQETRNNILQLVDTLSSKNDG